MPIYEYACQDCGHNFEKLQRISADPVRDCPSCKAEGTIKKLVSQTSFVLKGGGWYSDHYGLKGETGSGTSSESSTATGSDSDAGSSSSSSTKSTDSGTASGGSSDGGSSSKSGD